MQEFKIWQKAQASKMSWLATSYSQSFEDGGYEPPRPFSVNNNNNNNGNNNNNNNDNNNIIEDRLANSNENSGEIFVRESPYFKEEALERVRLTFLSFNQNQNLLSTMGVR